MLYNIGLSVKRLVIMGIGEELGIQAPVNDCSKRGEDSMPLKIWRWKERFCYHNYVARPDAVFRHV